MAGELPFEMPAGPVDALWDRFLTLQVDLAFESERPVLFGCDEWQRARTVLDVGTGNGAWLRRVAALAPDKSFTGAEPNVALLRFARAGEVPGNVRFVAGALDALTGQHELVTLRAVLQHLPVHDRVARTLRALLTDGGSFLVVDNDPALGRTWPPAPKTAAAYAAIARHLRACAGIGADYLDRFRDVVADCPGLTLADEAVVPVASTLPGNEARFQEQTMVALHLFRALGEVAADFAGAIAEWREWCAQPETFSQIGLRFLLVTAT